MFFTVSEATMYSSPIFIVLSGGSKQKYGQIKTVGTTMAS